MIILMLFVMILTLSTGLYTVNVAENVIDVKSLDMTEIAVFNDPILQYEGRQQGSSVKSLLSYLISNTAVNSESEERLPDITYSDSEESLEVSIDGYTMIDGKLTIVSDVSNTQITAISQLRKNISNSHFYEIEIEINDETGFVEHIIIKY